MSSKPKVIIKRVGAVLKMPLSIADKIVKANFIQTKLAGNAKFPLPYPSNVAALTQLGADILALSDSETQAKNKLPGSADARNAALTIVLNDLRSILTMVQNAADKDPANAETIILGAGFDVRKASARQRLINTVREGNVSGTVVVTAEGGGAHEWQMSKDQLAIITLPATYSARTSVENLTPGDVWYFRSRKILRKGNMGDWSAWARLMVH